MKVAYVAGPYRAKTIYGITQNIEKAKKLAVKLWKKGYAVICPHANSALMDGACDDSAFLDGGLELVRRSDFIVLVDGWKDSTGTLKEIELANELGIPVYHEEDIVAINLSQLKLKFDDAS